MISFPELPRYKAQWRALQFETIPGSGERFTFAIVAMGSDGSSDIRDTLKPGALRALLGPQGEVLHGMMIRCIIDIKTHLDNRGDWLNLPLPLSNVMPGPIRPTMADNLEQVFEQAIRLSASLGSSSIGADENAPADVDADIRSWAGRIKSFVSVMNEDLSKAFNRRSPIQCQGKAQATIGFMHDSYAASFGVLHSRSDRISADIAAIKRRLWDLQQLRYGQIIVPQTEIIVGHASFASLKDKPRMIKTLKHKLAVLELEAANASIGVFTTPDVRQAAEHIIKKIA